MSYPGRSVGRLKGLSEERSEPIALQESAEGVVGGLSGKASEALQWRKPERTDRPSRKATVEGLNGKPGEGTGDVTETVQNAETTPNRRGILGRRKPAVTGA